MRGHLITSQTPKGRARLPLENGLRLARFTIIKCLSDANQWDQAMTYGGSDFETYGTIGLSEMRAAFRMAELDDISAAICQHQG